MNKLIVLGILLLATGLTVQSVQAQGWFMYNHDTQCADCIVVEPNPFAHYSNTTLNGIPTIGSYQVHYLQPNEKPSYLDYNCWGCSESDYEKIFEEAGLWYYPK